MPHKIRLGLIGASVKGTWSARSHLPALWAAVPERSQVATRTSELPRAIPDLLDTAGSPTHT